MKANKLLIIYSTFVCLFLTTIGVLSAKNIPQLLNSLIFLPLFFYFLSKLVHTIKIPKTRQISNKKIVSVQFSSPNTKAPVKPEGKIVGVSDSNKRLFLKLIGSTSLTILLMSLFTKKAQASFFGSVPGPGTVALKNTSGAQIDPAEKSPTDGYSIANVDDTSTPIYYGFINKTGAWYILRQDSAGSYLYFKGSSSFATNWTNRASHSYDNFDTIFG